MSRGTFKKKKTTTTTEGVEEESCKGRRYLSPVVRPHEKGKQKQREQKRIEGGEACGCLLPISILEFQMLSEAVARRTRPSFAAPPIPFVPERWLFWARSTMLFESCHRPATTSCSRDSCNGEDAARYIEARSVKTEAFAARTLKPGNPQSLHVTVHMPGPDLSR